MAQGTRIEAVYRRQVEAGRRAGGIAVSHGEPGVALKPTVGAPPVRQLQGRRKVTRGRASCGTAFGGWRRAVQGGEAAPIDAAMRGPAG